MATWNETLEELVRQRGAALVSYGYLLTGNAKDAEDLFHDAVVKTFARGKGNVTSAEAEAYVRRTMFTTHMDDGRRKGTWARIVTLLRTDHLEHQDSPAAAIEFRTDLQEALMLLTPRERACTVLRFYDDLTAVAIGRELGISEGAVRRYLSDAAVKLRGHLGTIDDDPSVGVAYAPIHDSSVRK